MIRYYKGSFYFPVTEYPDIPHQRARLSKGNTDWYLPATPEVLHLLRNTDARASNKRQELEALASSTSDSISTLQEVTPVDFLGYSPPPLRHQMDAISRGFGAKHMALAADCGLGKTYIILHLIEEMKAAGLVTGALILCPASLVEEAWMDSVGRFTNLTAFNLREQRNVKVSKGKYKKEYVLPDKPFDIYVVNYEQIIKRADDFLQLPYNVFVADESTRLKNRGAVRAESACELSWKADYRWLMSGAMAPNGPEDYWNQFYTMDKGATLGTCHWFFMEETHLAFHPKSDPDKTFWKPTAAGAESIRARTRPLTLVYKIRECIDLPEMNFIQLKCKMTPKQQKAYNELRDELCTIIDGEYVIAKNQMSAMEKFGQITGGFATTDQGEIYQFAENPKLDLLLDMVDSIDPEEKIIIWAWHRHEVQYLYDELTKRDYSCEMLMGGMQGKLRNKLANFRGDSRILIANQAVLGHGHSFTFVHYMFFYSNSFDFELRHQAVSRIPRIGQDKVMFVYDLLCSDSIDIKLLKALASKDAMRKFLISTGV